MAEKIVSPGVFTKEIDQTFLPAAIGDIGAVVVGPTVKGPALVPTVVNSYSEFQAKFGDSFRSGSNYYQYLTSHTAESYLKNASPLTVVRILAGSYSGASATISSSVDPAVVGGGTPHSASITLVAGEYGGEGTGPAVSASLTPYGGTEVKLIFTGSTYLQRQGLVTDTATTLFFPSCSGQSAANNLIATSLSASNHFNKSSSLIGMEHISASAGAGIIRFTSSRAGAYGVPIGANVTSDNTPGGFEFGGSGPIYEYINLTASHDNILTTKNFTGGSDFSTTFKTPFKLHTLGDGTIMNNAYESTNDVNILSTSGSNGILTGGNSTNLRWEISSLNKNRGIFSLLIRRGDDTEKRKLILETWNNLTLDPNQDNYIGKMIGDQYYSIQGSGTDDPYLKLNGSYPNKSKYVRVEVLENTDDYLDENGNVRVPAYSASLPSFHSGSNSGSLGGGFSGGGDGDSANPRNFYENLTQTNMQGLDLSIDASGETSYLDALKLLNNQDEYDFNLLLLPGVLDNTHNTIVTKAIDICEDRGDCFVLVDPVGHDTSIPAVKTEVETRNSNYAASYWPWVQIPDNQTGTARWVPPSVVVAGMYAFNDKVAQPWFAPAGLNRGTLDTVIQVERKLTHGNRDDLYDSNVNPIATFPNQGVTVWGQKTMQKKASALDRVNVRRLLIKLKKFIASSSRFLVFEQNNKATRQRFLGIVNPYLEQVQSNSGVTSFRVVMDESNNTQDIVDRNILYGQIFIQPTRTAEFIVLDFTIQPTGATFPEI